MTEDRGIVVALMKSGEITVGIYPSYRAGGNVTLLEAKEVIKDPPQADRLVFARLPD